MGDAGGPYETETFRTEFLQSLADRGLRGVKLVIADDHKGLRAVARRVFNASQQRRPHAPSPRGTPRGHRAVFQHVVARGGTEPLPVGLSVPRQRGVWPLGDRSERQCRRRIAAQGLRRPAPRGGTARTMPARTRHAAQSATTKESYFRGWQRGSWPNETSGIRQRQECPDLTIASSTGQRHSAFWKFRLRGQASDMKVSFA